eukprot:g2234.t1
MSSLNDATSYVALAADDESSDRGAMWSPPTTLHAPADEEDGTQPRDVSLSETAKNGTFSSAVFNLTNTILGSGTLAMPYVCRISGIGVFTALLLVTAFAADVAVKLLFRAVEMLDVPHPRYPTLGYATYGRLGEQVAMWSVTLQQLGACIAYVVIVADLIQPITALAGADTVLADRWFVQIIVVVVIIFPLCLLPSMDSLKYASLFSLGCIIATVLLVMGNGAWVAAHTEYRQDLVSVNVTSHASDFELRFFPADATMLSGLPIVSFAFLCHQNTFPIYKELRGANADRMGRVGHVSMFICFVTYFISGLFGYITFVGVTDDDLLKNFKVSGTYISAAMDVVRVGFGLSVCLSYPLMVWEARHNLDVLFFGPQRPFSFKRHFGLSLGVITLAAGVGMAAPGIAPVLELVGSTCSPCMVYVLPALFFLKAQQGPWMRRKNCTALALLSVGLALIPICLFICTAGGGGGSSNHTNHTNHDLESLWLA